MYIKVRVIAGAKKELIIQESENHYKVSVAKPAERNLANDRILEIFRSKYPNTVIKIISGHHSPSKMLSVDP
jgi:uncharacterized protein YggU (UPF0235/DUF167 family)